MISATGFKNSGLPTPISQTHVIYDYFFVDHVLSGDGHNISD
ncbi:MAG TPA: hypothetical protein VIF10_17250 [Methylobacter sp.]